MFLYDCMFSAVLRYTPLGGIDLALLLLSPYPSFPALCCQDTSYPWRPAICATLMLSANYPVYGFPFRFLVLLSK